jgi:hypothetical protein
MKKVILIDPFNQTVEMKQAPTEQESFDYKSLLEMMECSLLDVVPLGGNVIMFVDDEGLLKDNRYFALAEVPYAGRVILAGESDEDGNSQSVPITVDQVKEHLTQQLRWPGQTRGWSSERVNRQRSSYGLRDPIA